MEPAELLALVARSRGARALIVDAGPLSAPVLTALGFVHLAVTTPCVWRPGGAAGADTSGCVDREPRA